MDRQHPHPVRRRLASLITAPLLCCAALIGNAGCDDRPAAPTPTPTPPPAHLSTPAATAPTTQELTRGKQKTIQLGAFPLTLDVPESWKTASTTNSLWVEGYAPGGEIRLQLTAQGQALKPFTVRAWEARASKEAADQPLKIIHSTLRPIGGPAKALDRREINAVNVTRDDGTIEKMEFVDWSIDALVPQDKDFTLDVLHFTGLTKDQYEKDKEFLEKILATLHYDAVPGAFP